MNSLMFSCFKALIKTRVFSLSCWPLLTVITLAIFLVFSEFLSSVTKHLSMGTIFIINFITNKFSFCKRNSDNYRILSKRKCRLAIVLYYFWNITSMTFVEKKRTLFQKSHSICHSICHSFLDNFYCAIIAPRITPSKDFCHYFCHQLYLRGKNRF